MITVMPTKPTIYCCIPRPGIIFMSLVFGFLGLIPSLFAVFTFDFSTIKSITAFIDCLCSLSTIVCTIAFFCSAYLAYKRRYTSFDRLLYIFWASILVDAINGTIFIKNAFSMSSHQHDIRAETPYNATEHHQLTEEQYYQSKEAIASVVHTVMPCVMTFLALFPFLNKVYFIIKMKSYIDYIRYKKEEARPVSVVELPHKLPQCSK